MKRYFAYFVMAAALLIASNSFAQAKPTEKKAAVTTVKDTAGVKKGKHVKKAAKKAAKTEKKAEVAK